MRQVHKNRIISRNKAVKNIMHVYNNSELSERNDWYNEANEFARDLSIKSGKINIMQACGVIAALSPRKLWDLNKKLAYHMVTNNDCSHMKEFVNKARNIIHCDGTEKAILNILNGQKISAFYLNIMYPEQAISITIDRHALAIIYGRALTDKEMRGITPKQYLFFSECYRHAAKRLNVNPLLVQSATWSAWRRLKKEQFNYRIKF